MKTINYRLLPVFKNYRIAFQISFAVSTVVLVLLYVALLLTGLISISFVYHLGVLLISVLVGFFCFFLIYYRIEKFISNRVKEIYKNLSPTDYPQFEKAMASDVTAITQSLQKFATDQKLEIELLKERENYRKEFIGNISHELKTPLFTIQGYILTLLDGGVKDKKIRKKYLNRAAKGGERLTFIIRDLDLITQFEAGIQNLEIKRFNLVDLVNNVFELLEMQAAKYNITLQFDTQYSDPIWVSADEERIMQVITNLIVNSLKYGVKNGLTEVGFTLVNDQKVIVSVRDNGEGIDEDHLPRLFERFYRIDKSGNRKQGGSGLGLSIVKHIIEAHQEKIYVKSTPGVGSEFSFSLQVEVE